MFLLDKVISILKKAGANLNIFMNIGAEETMRESIVVGGQMMTTCKQYLFSS
jgi:hypothetical protein